jgi:hypothetical protein
MSKVSWTAEEDCLLLQHYEKDGIKFCMALLPHRARHSIYQRMCVLRGSMMPKVVDIPIESDPVELLRRQYEDAAAEVLIAVSKRDRLRRRLNEVAQARARHTGFARRVA